MGESRSLGSLHVKSELGLVILLAAPQSNRHTSALTPLYGSHTPSSG